MGRCACCGVKDGDYLFSQEPFCYFCYHTCNVGEGCEKSVTDEEFEKYRMKVLQSLN